MCALPFLPVGVCTGGVSLGPGRLCVPSTLAHAFPTCGTCPWVPTPGSSRLAWPAALQPPEEPEDKPSEAEDLPGIERTPSGRIRRTSAQVAVFHLQEIAEDELARDWTKRRMKDDLVPETARVSSAKAPAPGF